MLLGRRTVEPPTTTERYEHAFAKLASVEAKMQRRYRKHARIKYLFEIIFPTELSATRLYAIHEKKLYGEAVTEPREKNRRIAHKKMWPSEHMLVRDYDSGTQSFEIFNLNSTPKSRRTVQIYGSFTAKGTFFGRKILCTVARRS